MNLPSFICAYDKATECLVFTIEIANVQEAILVNIFKRKVQDMQTDQYEISLEQAKMLNEHFNLNLDLNKYDYFLDCDRRMNQ